MSFRDTPQRRQLEQWLNSYVSLRGHEPMAHEIDEFLTRQAELLEQPEYSSGQMLRAEL